MAKRKDKPKAGLTRRERTRIINIIGYAISGIAAVAILYAVVVKRAPRPSPQRTRQYEQQQAAANQGPCPTRPGQAWEYDPASNCHFDPSPGHGHWHPGQPPDPAARAAAMSAAPATQTITPVPAPTPTEPEGGPGDSD